MSFKAINNEIYKTSFQKIRPAGKHLLTIGQELIQDPYAAIIELVKNSYDADSSYAKICFEVIRETDTLIISVEDKGDGMSSDDVINRWLVPSTDNKIKNKKSPKGRLMQGRKGIGRYAASILGDICILDTVKDEIETTVSICWDDLSKVEYLDQFSIPVVVKKTDRNNGTIISAKSKYSKNTFWNEKTINNLIYELKKLIPPISFDKDDEFNILISFSDFYSDNDRNTTLTIEPYPILELYDYRISGYIDPDGRGILTYDNAKIKNSKKERFDYIYPQETLCGRVELDIRVYDREKDSLQQLISRGLKDEQNQYVNVLQARALLNSVNGIGVYRNGFRIRPLGDPDYDWIELNKRRVQKPAMHIGSNQVIGYVHIESEEKSGLEEKSARDGLKSNEAYDSLKDITRCVIAELEARRFIFRRKTGLGEKEKQVGKQISELANYEGLKKSIKTLLHEASVPDELFYKIETIIDEESEQKNKTVEKIQEAFAQYQGEATLGKIIRVVLHEGRRPLNAIKNKIINLRFYGERFRVQKDTESFQKTMGSIEDIGNNSEALVDLFSRIDPLAARKRKSQQVFNLKKAIQIAFNVFEKIFEEKQFTYKLLCDDKVLFKGWQQDIYAIFVNLIDNSIYWILEKNCQVREITVTVVEDNENLTINYYDSGPGISDSLLESGVIFDPEFSTKENGNGTGLGLAIAGECAVRNNLALTALHSDKGAHFVLSTLEKELENENL